MFDDLGDQCVIFLFRVLLVQDAVLFSPQSHTPEAIFARIAGYAVEKIGTLIPTEITKAQAGDIIAAGTGFIDQFCRASKERVIAAVVRFVVEVEAVFQIFSVLNEVTVGCVA